MVSDNPLDAVAQQDHVPLNNQCQRQADQFELTQQLCKVDGNSFFHRFVLYQDQRVDLPTDSIPDLNQHPVKLQGQSHFAFNPVLTSSQFVRQASLIG
jgi:hypothetical protein